MTKLGLWCERVIEVSWLVAVAAIPMYFNVFSSRVFEPDKITVLRCLAMVMVVAYIVAAIESRQSTSGKASGTPASWIRRVWYEVRTDPVLLLAMVLVVISAISTVISIAPRSSLLGSYQRMQGFYTLISYIVVFLMMRRALRTRSQLDRLVTVAMVASIPIAIYGVMQHYHLDPLPWVGDTSTRVTSTLGNAIFLAAYLIMIVPITLAKLAATVRRAIRGPWEEAAPDSRADLGAAVIYGFVVALQMLFFSLYIVAAGSGNNAPMWWGVLPAIVVFVALSLLLPKYVATRRGLWIQAVGLGIAFIVQIIAVLLTESRGPWIGLAVGLLVLVPLVCAIVFPRWVSLAVAAAEVVVVVLFVGIVIWATAPSSPVAPLMENRYFERVASVTQLDSGTNRVRTLIWSGVGELMTTLPGVGLDDDPLRVVRPVLGYGPESMYVAYNKVYPPELAHLEVRTASPDRSHNDILDYLVTTGLAGVFSYLALFVVLLVTAWRYVRRAPDVTDKLLLVGIVGALVSHFVESQFGIVIVSTRLLFWVYAGILVAAPFALGFRAKEDTTALEGAQVAVTPEPALAFATASPGAVMASRERQGKAKAGGKASAKGRSREHNGGRAQRGGTDTWQMIGFVTLAVYMVLTIFGALIAVLVLNNTPGFDPTTPYFIGLAWAVIGIGIAARAIEWKSVGRVSSFNWSWVIYVVLAVALVLGLGINGNVVVADIAFKQGMGIDEQAAALMSQGQTAQAFNARLQAVAPYRQALGLAPDEDYYYLFLGRSYIELARLAKENTSANPIEGTVENALNLPLKDVAGLSKQEHFLLAKAALERAQALNPLNTDHTANLARLYRSWAQYLDPAMLDKAPAYYEQAVTLSPRSALLYDEWAEVELSRNQAAVAVEKLMASLAVDSEYARTYVLLGDAYERLGNKDEAFNAHSTAIELDLHGFADERFEARVNAYLAWNTADQLAAVFGRSLEANMATAQPSAYGAYGYLLARLGRMSEAAAQFETQVQMTPYDWIAQRNLAYTYRDLGRMADALTAAKQALQTAPPDQVQGLQDLVTQLQNAND